MLTRTLTLGVIAGILAYASGALAHDPRPYAHGNSFKNNYYSYPYGTPYSNYGSGWSLSLNFGSSFGSYGDQFYTDRRYRGGRGYAYPKHVPGRFVYVPSHSVGPACDYYGYHRH